MRCRIAFVSGDSVTTNRSIFDLAFDPQVGDSNVSVSLSIREGGDRGLPIVVGKPDGAEGKSFMELAQKVAQRVSIENASRTAPSVTMQSA